MIEADTVPAPVSTPPLDDPAELTRYIEQRYHDRHREQLPPLVEIAAKVERVHAGKDHVPAGLSAVLHKLLGELSVHMRKEELVLFPAIRNGAGTEVAGPIAMMRAEHDDHSHEMGEIRRITNDITLPEGACRTWTMLYAGLDEFVTDLAEHIRLENEVLFPRFEG